MIDKVISGGQTGADRAGLMAAKKCGVPTGGWMPHGFLAQDGLHPEFAEMYGIQEHSSPKYPPRTALNVKESDGTVRFASNFNSPGELLTAKMVSQYNKPSFDIDIWDIPGNLEFIQWLADNKIRILNVAGNSEKTSPGIQDVVYKFLVETFSQ